MIYTFSVHNNEQYDQDRIEFVIFFAIEKNKAKKYNITCILYV